MSGQEKTKNRINLSPAQIIALAVVAVVALFYIGCNLYLSVNNNSITTEVAMLDTTRKTVNAEVFIVRDEHILTSSAGNIVSAVSDGTRVSASDTVAFSFADSDSAATVMRIAEVEKELEYYNALSRKSSYITDNTKVHDNKIIDSISDLAAVIASGDFSSLDDVRSAMRDSITSKQTATGVEIDVTDTVSALNAELSTLRAAAGRYTEVRSTGTGYYAAGVDGYESTLDYSAMKEWSIEDVEKAISSAPSATTSDQFGRLIRGYYWYITCVVDTQSINQLRENKIYTIGFQDSSTDEIKCTLKRISSDAQSGKSVVVFSCNIMTEELASLRTASAYIVLNELKGYKINSKALHTDKDNNPGVYVLDGRTINFKKVEIIYSDDNYTLVTSPFLRGSDEDMRGKSAASYLSIYEEYVVSGHDLYDGKILK